MLKKLRIKYSKFMNYGLILLLITFLFNILLYENAHKTLYLLSITCGFSTFIILRANTITVEKIGFGMTRKEIERIFLFEILYIVAYSIILIAFDVLFVYIVKGKLNVSFLRIIEYYQVSFFLSLFIAFLRNNIKKTNKMIFIFLLTISLLIIIMTIKNLYIVNILLTIIIVSLYFINRHIFYNEDIH